MFEISSKTAASGIMERIRDQDGFDVVQGIFEPGHLSTFGSRAGTIAYDLTGTDGKEPFSYAFASVRPCLSHHPECNR